MIGRIVIWGTLIAITVVVAWLWPQIDRTPDDHEIARQFLDDGKPADALLFFEDSKWRGIAAYRSGRYAEATREFGKDETVASLFNLGNAYVQLKDWKNAIATYERVLRFNPGHEDARHNLALVKSITSPPTNRAVDVEAPLKQKQKEGEDSENTAAMDATPQSTRARESEKSDKAGNTSETDEVGETDRTPRPQKSTGDAGRAGAVGETSEEKDSRDNRSAGTVDLKSRSSKAASDVLLRRIKDDPEKVLKARLKSAYQARTGGTTE